MSLFRFTHIPTLAKDYLVVDDLETLLKHYNGFYIKNDLTLIFTGDANNAMCWDFINNKLSWSKFRRLDDSLHEFVIEEIHDMAVEDRIRSGARPFKEIILEFEANEKTNPYPNA